MSNIRIGIINVDRLEKVNLQKFKYVIDDSAKCIQKNNILGSENFDSFQKFAYPFFDENIYLYEKASGLDLNSTDDIVRKMK